MLLRRSALNSGVNHSSFCGHKEEINSNFSKNLEFLESDILQLVQYFNQKRFMETWRGHLTNKTYKIS